MKSLQSPCSPCSSEPSAALLRLVASCRPSLPEELPFDALLPTAPRYRLLQQGNEVLSELYGLLLRESLEKSVSAMPEADQLLLCAYYEAELPLPTVALLTGLTEEAATERRFQLMTQIEEKMNRRQDGLVDVSPRGLELYEHYLLGQLGPQMKAFVNECLLPTASFVYNLRYHQLTINLIVDHFRAR